ncbi:MAG: SUMF1/EgtB/PvdO family nonheme iron enzyme [bacterium]
MGDAATGVLVLIALLPASVFARVLAGALRWRRAVLAWLVALFALAWITQTDVPGYLEPLLLLWIAVAAVYPFLELVAVWSSSERAWVRGTMWVGLAALWGLQIILNLPERILEPAGKVAFWQIDAFDKFLLATAGAGLRAFGLDATIPVLVREASPFLVFFGQHLFGFTFAGNLVLVALLYECVRGKAPQLPPRAVAIRGRIPAAVTVIAIVARISLERAKPWGTALSIAWQMVAAMFAASGAWQLFLLTSGRAWARALFGAGAVTALIHPPLCAVPLVAGVVASLVPLGRRAAADRHADAAVQDELARALARVRRWVRPRVALPLALVLLLPARFLEWDGGTGPGRAPRVPARPAPPLDSSMVRVSTEDGAYDIDRYEFPARAGELPLTGVSPSQASALCAAEGKHLCSRDEWYWACSDHGRLPYILTESKVRDRTNRLNADCNLRSAAGLRPAGARPGCRNPLELFDLAGNALELVTFPDLPGWYGFAGAYYGLSDDLTQSCHFALMAHEAQLPLLDLEPVGFRCCR